MAVNSMSGPRKGSRYHRLDDIPKDSFTPRTYQIELLDAALKRNTILCLGSSESKVFLALMVAKQLASVTRLPLKAGGKRTLYLTDSEDEMNAISLTLPHHTDLNVGKLAPGQFENLTNDQNEDTDSDDKYMCSADIWQQYFDTNNIIVTTGTLFLMALQNHYISLKNVNLLIFDDCHKCVNDDNHPYVSIVSNVAILGEKAEQPHILGVTASIAGTECNQPESLQHIISSMEKSMMAHAETSMLILSERFGCRPIEYVIECQEIPDNQPLLADELEDILLYNLEFFEECRIAKNESVDFRDPTEIPIKVLAECHNILQVLGSWCTSSIAEYFIMQLDKIIKYEKNDIHKKFLRCVCTTLRGLTKYFEKNFKPDYDVDQFLEYTTSKIRELAKILRNYKPEVDFMIINNESPFDNDADFSDLSDDNEDDDDLSLSGSDGGGENDLSGKSSFTPKPMHIAVKRGADGTHERIMTFSEEEEKNLCGVVFVKNNFIAFGLNKLIEEICSWDENLCFVKSSHIMGHGLRGGNSKQKLSKTFKRQEETLRKFRMQERNLIIATKELEDGIDIPKCNLVLCFDPPMDYRSYTLSKGRARARDASYYILLDEETQLSFNSKLDVFKGIEEVLMGKNRMRDLSESEDEEDVDIRDQEFQEIPPPYSSCFAKVDIHGAISLINRYCAKLPSDAFTHLSPQCRVEKVHGQVSKYRAYLRLPINSPVKEELGGPEILSRKLAEKAVALKMCEILHKKGELDENLVPVGKEMFLYEEEEEWADEEDQAGQARPGTTKRKQYYIKKVADALMHSRPQPGKCCYLYLFNLRLTGRITDEQNTRGRVIYAPEDTSQTLGVLMSKKIPEIPCFPIYTRSGEVTASIDLLDTSLVLQEDEIQRLSKFHHFVFSGVLHLVKEPMEFSTPQADIGCIIVPLDGTDALCIDWDFVDKVIAFGVSGKRAGSNKQSRKENFNFCLNEFNDAVVMPSYRNIDQPQHFYVAEIRQDLNPLSPFPSPELYKTFQDYYTTKYGLVITDTEQPLLDVDHTSARLNLLTPRYMNQKGVALPTSSAETKRARRENLQQKQILVPELCDVHVFPASLWRKTVCLPAILYRTNCLLLAEELRCKISRETGIGIEVLPSGFKFPKLDFGFETSPEKLKEAESGSDGKSPGHSDEKGDEKQILSIDEKTDGCSDLRSSSSSESEDSMEEGRRTEQDEPPLNQNENHLECHIASSNVELSPSQKSHEALANEKETEDNNCDIDFNVDCCDKRTTSSTLRKCSWNLNQKQESEKCLNNGETFNHTIYQTLISDRVNSKEEKKLTLTGCINSGDMRREEDTTNLISHTVQQCSSSEQALLSSNHPNFALRQQTASSNLSTPSRSLSKESHSHPKKDFPTCPSTTGESTAQISSSMESNSIYIINHVDNCETNSHFIEPPRPSTCPSNSTATSANNANHVPTSLRDGDSHVKNDSCPNIPPGAMNNVVNNQVLCTSPSVTSNFDSFYSNPLVTPISSSIIPYSSSVSSSTRLSSLSSPSFSSSAMRSEPCATPITPLRAAVVTISHSGPSTKSSPLPGPGAPNLQNSADSSSSSFSVSSTAALDTISGSCKLNHQEMPGDSSIEGSNHSGEGDNPQRNEHFMPNINTNLCACQGCDNKIKFSPPHVFDPTSHPSPETNGDTGDNFESGFDETPVIPKHENNQNQNLAESFSNGNSNSSLSDENHIFSKSKRNGYNKTLDCMDIVEDVIETEASKTLFNGFCHDQNEANNEKSNSKRANDSSQQSKGENHFESALIMNTLSTELNNDLKIDLIQPQLETIPSFDSNETLWNNKNKQESSSGWQQTNQGEWEHDVKNSSKTKSSFQSNSFPYFPENLGNESHKLTDSDLIKFSFSGKISDHDQNKDLVIDTWNCEKKKDTEADAEVKIKAPISSKEDCQSQKPVSPSPTPPPEKEKIEPTLGNSDPSIKSSQSNFPTVSVWKSPKPLPVEPGSENCEEKDHVIKVQSSSAISLDEDRDLSAFIGPSPCLILQALTMSNANDFFSLERLETIGDSFLKYAITVYLYCSYPGIHEGKLSYLRSKQVSNYNLYRLGRRKNIAEYMVSTKFEPYENWLPPGFVINNERRRGPVPKVVIASSGSKGNNTTRNFFVEESGDTTKQDEAVQFNKELEWIQQTQEADQKDDLEDPNKAAVPYSLQCQHGLPDKSVADCVEALIGCYLTTCGRKAALMFMSWLGLKVLPKKLSQQMKKDNQDPAINAKRMWQQISEQEFDELQCPPSPMFFQTPENKRQLNHLLEGFDVLEDKIGYKFRDKSYLLQAFTHASYHYNTITDCYQRVEFLGDAILDYVITRHLYEDSQKYSPGILTDLRSALVNNNIFAALAVKWGFHCYFKAISPSLFAVIDKFVTKQTERGHDDIDFDEEYQELTLDDADVDDGNEEDDNEEEVEMEIPKALGDIFESVAGAIYLDSGMSLDTVWQVYYRMMKPYIDKYLKSIPKSLVRELLEREPETAKFERPERTINGKVRVTVNVVGKGVFSGIGRNYRIAKSAAAKKALRAIRALSQNGNI